MQSLDMHTTLNTTTTAVMMFELHPLEVLLQQWMQRQIPLADLDELYDFTRNQMREATQLLAFLPVPKAVIDAEAIMPIEREADLIGQLVNALQPNLNLLEPEFDLGHIQMDMERIYAREQELEAARRISFRVIELAEKLQEISQDVRHLFLILEGVATSPGLNFEAERERLIDQFSLCQEQLELYGGLIDVSPITKKCSRISNMLDMVDEALDGDSSGLF